MENNRINLGSIASDVTITVKNVVKDTYERWNENQESLRREREFRALNPIFAENINDPNFSFPKLVRVAEIDRRHAESAICKDSIGYTFKNKDLAIVTFYPDKIDTFNLQFYPDMEEELYYVDPIDRSHYIALDEYFSYLKIARVNELQKVAQDLGAKHFRVIYKEQKKSFSSKEIKAKAGVKAPARQGGAAEGTHDERETRYAKIEIAAEMTCIGHEPIMPTLYYFDKDPQIKNLIELRMSDNRITSQSYTLELSKTSGIKAKDALKIDAALNAMKIAGNATVASEVQNEARRVFEYEIDF